MVRSQAFSHQQWPPNRPAWPDEVEDLFPGDLIPEVDRQDLSVDTLRSGILNHGSLLVRNLVPAEQVERLTADIDRALASYDAAADGDVGPELAGWYQRFERDDISSRERKRTRGAIMAVESPPTLFDLLETFDDVGVSDVVRGYFGEQPLLMARKATLRLASHTRNTGGWHQDGAFMGAGIRSLNIWLSLSHCGDVAPGLDVVGKRLDHIVQTGTKFSAWATNPKAAQEAAAGVLVRPIFGPGDALLFDHMNLHRTAIDPEMEHDRYAIETWLFGASTYESMTAQVDEGYDPRDQVPILF
ncbi:MAG: phytanoyl-CoA dioxygenase family protein [Acidimicrobiia bacterium]|nr:phytanoyl-CoA dioxygenase family protein [Acidimicrobiia bacterium]